MLRFPGESHLLTTQVCTLRLSLWHGCDWVVPLGLTVVVPELFHGIASVMGEPRFGFEQLDPEPDRRILVPVGYFALSVRQASTGRCN